MITRYRSDAIPKSWSDDNTVDAVLSTTQPVEIWDADKGEIREVIDINSIQYDEPVVLCDTHNRYSVSNIIGSVTNIRVEGDNLVGRLSIMSSKTDVIEAIKAGYLRDVSIGYRYTQPLELLEKGDDGLDTYIARNVKLIEVSLCPVGADNKAKIRKMEELSMEKEKKVVNQETKDEDMLLKERERVSVIIGLCRSVDIDPSEYITSGATIDAVRADILDKMIKERHTVGVKASVSVEVDAIDKFREAAVTGISARLGVKDVERNEFSGTEIIDIAKAALRQSGVSVPVGRQAIIERAITTSDLPYILGGALDKVVADAYQEAGATWQAWCSTGTLSNFKQSDIVRLGALDNLDFIPEDGAYTNSSITDAKETVKLATYGKLVTISRQALINDDMNLLADMARACGSAAARKINSLVYSVLNSYVMSDGIQLFHNTHKNIGTAGAVSVTTIGEAVKLMRKQRDVSNNQVLNLNPRYFIAPVTLETQCEMFFTSSLVSDSNNPAGKTNIYGGNRFVRIYDAELDEYSATAWYLAADKGKTITVFYLNGQERPYIAQVNNELTDGLTWKVRIDVAAAPVDYKGLVKNAGA